MKTANDLKGRARLSSARRSPRQPQPGARSTGAPYHARSRQESGGVLIVTLLLASILGFTLGSYLYWVRTQNVLVAESQSWNAALALAEAGIEEGLSQINVNFGQGDPTAIGNYTNSAGSNFVFSGGVYGPKTNMTLTDGSYSVTIQPAQNANSGPTITAVGYTTLPLVNRPISRKVQVTTSIKSLLANGITAISNVNLVGNNIMTDSYDSSDPNHSTNGSYYAGTRLAGGDVSSLYGIIGIQNANIYGHIETGVNDTNTPTYGVNGRAGDLSWAGPGIESGWWLQDFNMDTPDIKPPFSSAGTYSWPSKTTVSGTNFYTLGSGSYYSSTYIQLGNNDFVQVTGNTVLYVVNGDSHGTCFGMNNNAVISIAAGCSLKIYLGNSTGSAVSANFGSVNASGNASTFAIYGLPTLTSLTWNGNNTYLGTVYAPEANFTLGGGGSTPYDFMGALTVGSISMNGHFNIHYDQNLRRQSPASGFTVNSWREL